MKKNINHIFLLSSKIKTTEIFFQPKKVKPMECFFSSVLKKGGGVRSHLLFVFDTKNVLNDDPTPIFFLSFEAQKWKRKEKNSFGGKLVLETLSWR